MRVAVLSDIHANLAALDAVLAAADGVDEVWHLGDVVGYGPDPDAVVERLVARGAIGVRGNHDAAAVGDLDVDWFNPIARQAMEWTTSMIGPDTRTWLAALPEREVRGEFTLVHGSPRHPIWEYVTSASEARASFTALETRHGLHGHTHMPLAWRLDRNRAKLVDGRDGATVPLADARLLLNPGSVGQPRDGIPTASWLVLDTEAGTAGWQRTAYDIPAVQARMRAAGLPDALVRRLEVGR